MDSVELQLPHKHYTYMKSNPLQTFCKYRMAVLCHHHDIRLLVVVVPLFTFLNRFGVVKVAGGLSTTKINGVFVVFWRIAIP